MLGWLIEQLVGAIFSIVLLIFIVVMQAFVGDLSFIPHPNQFGGPLAPYHEFLFGPISNTVKTAFTTAALSIILINAIIQLYRNMFENDTNAPGPTRVLWNSVKYAIFTGLWYPGSTIALNIGATIWQTVVGNFLGEGMLTSAAAGVATGAANIGDRIVDFGSQLVQDAAFATAAGAAGGPNAAASAFVGLEAIKGVGSVLASVVGVLLLIHIIIGLFKAALALVQRFVILAILQVFGPLAMAFGNNVRYENLSKSYISMFISNLLNLLLSSFFIMIIVFCSMHLTQINSSLFLGLLALDSVVIITGEIDSYLGQLGLRSGGAGGSVGNSLTASMGTAKALGRGTVAGVSTYRMSDGSKGARLGAALASATGMGNLAKSGAFGSEIQKSYAGYEAKANNYPRTSNYAAQQASASYFDEASAASDSGYASYADKSSKEAMEDYKLLTSQEGATADYYLNNNDSSGVDISTPDGNVHSFELRKSSDGTYKMTRVSKDGANASLRHLKAQNAVPTSKQFENYSNKLQSMSQADRQTYMQDTGVGAGTYLTRDESTGQYQATTLGADGSISHRQIESDHIDMSGNSIVAQVKGPENSTDGSYTSMYFDSSNFSCTMDTAAELSVPQGASNVTYSGNKVTYESGGDTYQQVISSGTDTNIPRGRQNVAVQEIPNSSNVRVTEKVDSVKGSSGFYKKEHKIAHKQTKMEDIGANSPKQKLNNFK